MTGLNACDAVVTSYLQELRGLFNVISAEDRCVITTPFVRPDGEAIELSVELTPAGPMRVGDMGDTLGYLHVNGLTLTRSVVDTASYLSRTFGASLIRGQIVSQIQHDKEVGQAFQRVLQAVLAVSDLIQKRRTAERANFDAQVESFIIVTGNVYDTDYDIAGRRSTHRVRFHVNSNRKLLIQPLSAASESAAYSWGERWAYRFGDILEQDDTWRCRALLDDRGARSSVWSERALKPLEGYAVLWSTQSEIQELLIPSRS